MDTSSKPPSRIQRRNRERILQAALEVFSQAGFRGATLDQVASQAGLSKPNLLYYFSSKEEIHATLLGQLMESWLEPLQALDPEGDPVEEILAYVHRKLDMAHALPRESRLFANEILQGAPRIATLLNSALKPLFESKCAMIAGWVREEKLAQVDPHHLIFSIWATTQHYADFDAQVQVLLPNATKQGARAFLDRLYRTALTP